MSLFKPLKLVFKLFKRKKGKSTEAKNPNDLLQNFIIEKEIRCYEYSNFKELTRKGNSVRAKFDDEFFTLEFLCSSEETIREVLYMNVLRN